jgi:hypothetical protein
MQPGQLLYSRYEDGSHPVRVEPTGWAVDGLGTYTTAKGLLVALTGHPEGRHWSLERYFKLGPKYGSKPVLVEHNVLEILPLVQLSTELSIPKPRSVTLGIDLAKRAHEVRKLLFAGFGRRMFLSGYDPEDVLQEVYKGLLIRNAGTCPFNPAKSSFGHYVHLVISCVLSNYHRKHHRIHTMELSSETPIEGVAPLSLEAEESLVQEAMGDFLGYLTGHEGPDSLVLTQVVPLLLAGTPRNQLASVIGVPQGTITRVLTTLRDIAPQWKHSLTHPA